MRFFYFFSTDVCSSEIVYVSTIEELQSVYDFEECIDQMWVYTHPVETAEHEITFSDDTKTERNWD